MTRLYIANTTVQDRKMPYRLVGYDGQWVLDIPRGQQVPMPKDMTSDEINGIIEQQETFGMVAAANVGQARQHISALYSIGKPVTEAQMRQALERNLALMGEEGLKLRKMASVGISSVIADQAPDNYLGARVEVVEKSESPVVNEMHRHRRDGDYSNRAPSDIYAPETTPIRKRGRPAGSRNRILAS